MKTTSNLAFIRLATALLLIGLSLSLLGGVALADDNSPSSEPALQLIDAEPDGYAWSDGYVWIDGYAWSD